MHNSTYVYAPGHGNYHFGQKKIKRRMKVVELKCELLNRVQDLKGGKEK